MPNLKDIRRRIESVQKTQQITSAMRMVAAAKLRRAEEAVRAARPYAARMRATLDEVAGSGPDADHPLLRKREEVKSLELVLVTSDRGLAGAFNSNSIKEADRVLKEREPGLESVSLTLLGNKGRDFFRRRRSAQIRHATPVGNRIAYAQAVRVAHDLARRYEEGEVDEIVLVYSDFVSTMTQTPRASTLLPFAPQAAPTSDGDSEDAAPYEFEPNAAALLGTLVPKAVEVEIFRALLENQAGEHAARMAAMESATRNTEELIDKLTLEFNRARQAAITRELVEIVTGAQALE